MNKLLSTFALVSALGFGVFGVNSLSYAEDAAPAAEQAAKVLVPEVAPEVSVSNRSFPLRLKARLAPAGKAAT